MARPVRLDEDFHMDNEKSVYMKLKNHYLDPEHTAKEDTKPKDPYADPNVKNQIEKPCEEKQILLDEKKYDLLKDFIENQE